jgi:hypothetical protein
VPANRACAAPNASHGAPLAVASCSPPEQASDYLTVGSPDANGQIANSTGYVLLKVVGESPIDFNNGDQADVNITFRLSDVRRKSDLGDYNGQLRAVLPLRITDRFNGSGNDQPATTSDVTFPFTVACTTTPGILAGSNCNLTTTADAVMANSVLEGKRSVWRLGQVQVFDGGADEQASTTGDNTLFAVQGTYVP